MARSEREVAAPLAERWKREAFGYEQQARSGEYTAIEKRMLNMHARVLHACSDELKRELGRVRRD